MDVYDYTIKDINIALDRTKGLVFFAKVSVGNAAITVMETIVKSHSVNAILLTIHQEKGADEWIEVKWSSAQPK